MFTINLLKGDDVYNANYNDKLILKIARIPIEFLLKMLGEYLEEFAYSLFGNQMIKYNLKVKNIIFLD